MGLALQNYMKRTLLFDPAPADGGENTPAPAPAAPPAAAVVVNSDVKESDAGELVELRRKLADEAAAKKAVEMRAAELEDENRRLKAVPAPATPKSKQSMWDEFFGTP
jgi:hypothetical protein